MKKQLTKKEKQQQMKIDSARVIFAGVIILVVAVLLFIGFRTFTMYGDNYVFETIKDEEWFDTDKYILN